MHERVSHGEESTLKPGFQSIRINIYSPYVYQAIKTLNYHSSREGVEQGSES